jgi:DnaJ-domain-containing protein 1
VQSFYDRLGNILRERLDSDADPFESWEPHTGKTRQAGNSRERTPPPRRSEGKKRIAVPPELVQDFAILGVQSGVSPEECKAAWKSLMKAHHPDKQNQNPGEQEKATRLSIRINDSYHRIKHWYQTGSLN